MLNDCLGSRHPKMGSTNALAMREDASSGSHPTKGTIM
jgi:hypothetical protein